MNHLHLQARVDTLVWLKTGHFLNTFLKDTGIDDCWSGKKTKMVQRLEHR
jgi:hypothetical protein